MKPILINDIHSIRNAANDFITQMDSHTVFAFYGKMGAGKTTFIKAVCEELGVTDDVINSPTFAIVNEYHLQKTGDSIFHFDFYRIRNIREAFDLGAEDYFYSGSLCFIEWPEKIGDMLPDNAMYIEIRELPDGSRVVEKTDRIPV